MHLDERLQPPHRLLICLHSVSLLRSRAAVQIIGKMVGLRACTQQCTGTSATGQHGRAGVPVGWRPAVAQYVRVTLRFLNGPASELTPQSRKEAEGVQLSELANQPTAHVQGGCATGGAGQEIHTAK